MPSGWLNWGWYLIRMGYGNVIISYITQIRNPDILGSVFSVYQFLLLYSYAHIEPLFKKLYLLKDIVDVHWSNFDIDKENHPLQLSCGIWPDKFPKIQLGPDWCCGLCLLRVSEVWGLSAPDIGRWVSPTITSNQDQFNTRGTFVLSSQILAWGTK